MRAAQAAVQRIRAAAAGLDDDDPAAAMETAARSSAKWRQA
jgi:hypothetical protein